MLVGKKNFFRWSTIICELLLIGSIIGVIEFGKGITLQAVIEMSIADYFVLLDDATFKIFFMTPIFLWMLTELIKEETRVQVIVRKRNRVSIWRKLFCKMVGAACFFSINTVVAVLFIGGADHAVFYNWNQKYSLYWLRCEGTVLANPEVNLHSVVFRFFITELLLLCIIGCVFFICSYLCANIVWGWLFCMGGVLLLHTTQIQTDMLRDLSIQWQTWRYMERWNMAALKNVFLLFLLFLTGSYIAKKKEFLNEK